MAEVTVRVETNDGTPIGSTGDQYLGGSIWRRADPRVDLQGQQGTQILDRMRLDAEIAAALSHGKYPIRAGEWTVDPVDPEDEEEVEIAEWVKDKLMPSYTYQRPIDSQGWDERLKNALSSWEFGFSLGEMLWDVDEDGRKYIRKIDPRLQTSVLKWNFEPSGDFASVTQQAIFPDGRMRTVEIPADRLALFVYDREGNNLWGRPATAACYLHWYHAKHLLELDGILKERFGGTPWIEVKAGMTADADAIRDLKLAISNFRIHHEQALILPNPFEGRLEFPQGANANLLDSVKYHDSQKSRTLGAEFMQHGLSQSGARAVTETKAGLLFIMLRGLCKPIEAGFNSYYIVPCVRANWGDRKAYPRLRAPDFEQMRSGELVPLAKQLVEARILTPDDALEDFFREQLKVSKRDPKTARQPLPPQEFGPNGKPIQNGAGGGEGKGKQPGAGETDDEDGGAKQLSEGLGRRLRREPYAHERHVAFADMADYLDRRPLKIWTLVVQPIRLQQMDLIARAAARATMAQLTKGDLPRPFVPRMVKDLGTELATVYERGRRTILEDRIRQTGKDVRFADGDEEEDEDEEDFVVTPAQKSWIKGIAGTFAALSIAALLTEAVRAATVARQSNASSEAVERAVREALGEMSEPVQIADLSGAVSRAFTNGRNDQITSMPGEWESIYYSAMMDDNTCQTCEVWDGELLEPEEVDGRIPNPDCDAPLRCRCSPVAIAKTEQIAASEGNIVQFFDPNQPRDPAGTSTGGQFTGAGGGGGAAAGKQVGAKEAAKQKERHDIMERYVPDKATRDAIEEAQRKADAMPRTYGDDSPGRVALREQAAEQAYGEGAAVKGREAWIVTGSPASGKNTSVAEPLAKKNGALIIDNDEMKKLLPEYAGGLGAGAVHDEASLVIQPAVIARAITAGDNIVMPRVGKTYGTLKSDVSELRKAGYKVHMVYVDVPDEVAVERAVKRFKSSGRLVSVSYVHSVDGHPRNSFKKAKAERIADSYEVYDNNVPKGTAARKVE